MSDLFWHNEQDFDRGELGLALTRRGILAAPHRLSDDEFRALTGVFATPLMDADIVNPGEGDDVGIVRCNAQTYDLATTCAKLIVNGVKQAAK